ARDYRIGDPEEVRGVVVDRLSKLGRAAEARRVAAAPAAEKPKDKLDGTWSAADLVDAESESTDISGVIEVARADAGDAETPDVEQLLERAVESNIAAAQIVAELN